MTSPQQDISFLTHLRLTLRWLRNHTNRKDLLSALPSFAVAGYFFMTANESIDKHAEQLAWWPFYEVGAIITLGLLISAYASRERGNEEFFSRLVFVPMVIVGFCYFGEDYWLSLQIIGAFAIAKALQIFIDRPDETQATMGCLPGCLGLFLIFIVGFIYSGIDIATQKQHGTEIMLYLGGAYWVIQGLFQPINRPLVEMPDWNDPRQLAKAAENPDSES